MTEYHNLVTNRPFSYYWRYLFTWKNIGIDASKSSCCEYLRLYYALTKERYHNGATLVTYVFIV